LPRQAKCRCALGEHRNTALTHDGRQSPEHNAGTSVVKCLCDTDTNKCEMGENVLAEVSDIP
jgi:hypothetical protein